MTTRKFLQLFSRNSDRNQSQPETPQGLPPEFEQEFGGSRSIGTNKLHRSKSGRLKESNKIRPALAQVGFTAPEDKARNAPMISKNKPGSGLTSRDLTIHESGRIRQSLPFSANNSPAQRDTSKALQNSEVEDPDADETWDEVF